MTVNELVAIGTTHGIIYVFGKVKFLAYVNSIVFFFLSLSQIIIGMTPECWYVHYINI